MGKYFIIEIQTDENGSSAYLVQTADDENHAKSVYYQTLAAVWISNVKLHSVVLLDAKANPMLFDFCEH
ncbi:MAG: hypothetical protein K5663_11440 [Clostridiales bacterium]|nr:hypothetical protein [Clostridiales bacterium]